jgi:hypothetical protein
VRGEAVVGRVAEGGVCNPSGNGDPCQVKRKIQNRRILDDPERNAEDKKKKIRKGTSIPWNMERSVARGPGIMPLSKVCESLP